MRRAARERSSRGAVVVITGASSGIGRATAHAFARRGARLVLAARGATPLEVVARECEVAGAEAIACPTDVRSDVAVEALRRSAVDAFGRIDVWVNDAGVSALGTVEATPSGAVRELFDTNVLGVLHGAQSAVAQFRRQPEGGVLINLAGVASELPCAHASAYCASKHAMRALTETLRQELHDAPIDVCLVSPPDVDTPLVQHSANFTGRALVAQLPLIEAIEVAEAIVRCAERPEPHVIVGTASKLLLWARRLVPRALDRLQHALVERQRMLAQHAVMSVGNLDRPMEPHSVSGGWAAREGGACD